MPEQKSEPLHVPEVTLLYAEEKGPEPIGYGVACKCGWMNPYIWTEVWGARHAFIDHLLAELVPGEWGSVHADFDQTDEDPDAQ